MDALTTSSQLDKIAPFVYPSGVSLNKELLESHIRIDPSGRVMFRVARQSAVNPEATDRENFKYYPCSRIVSDNVVLSPPNADGERISSIVSGASCPVHLVNRSVIQREKVGRGGLSDSAGMSRKTGRNVTEIVSAMDREFGKKKQLFLTATLPGSTPEAFEALARWSGYAVNRLNRYFNLRLKNDHARLLVWEFQKRGALHCHIVIGSHEDMSGLTTKDFKYKWCEILASISAKTGTDLFRKNKNKTHKDNWDIVRADVQKIKKSAAAYLAKYMSKSVKEIDDTNNKRFFPPSRWATWTRNCNKIREKFTHHKLLGYLEPGLADELLGFFKEAMECLKSKDSKIIDTRKYGDSNTCIYGLIDWNSDCIHAVKEVGDIIENTINNKNRWLFWFPSSERLTAFYERKRDMEIFLEKKQLEHDRNIQQLEKAYAKSRESSLLENPSVTQLDISLVPV